ncbi:MAG: hypothetical protein KDA92_02430 [Planctomycetales bacterium]|nr:hypothetical protein [Planctomycetales bacterium]MCA9166549.1 hypothetical protein [Planctomycetales bacterium]
MTDNWDWVNTHERRAKSRRFVAILFYIPLLLIFAWYLSHTSVFHVFRLQWLQGKYPEIAESEDTTPEIQLEPNDSLSLPPAPSRIDTLPGVPAPEKDELNSPQPRLSMRQPRIDKAAEARDELVSLRRTLSGAPFSDAITALAEFRQRHAEHVDSSEVASIVREYGYRPWLQLARAEAEEVSPNSECFGEVWLPIASAWSVYGEDAEMRDAMRQAYAATDRILTPERQYRWALDLFRHDLFTGMDASHLVETAVQATTELGNIYAFRSMSANVAGFAAAAGKHQLAKTLLDQALAPEPGVPVTLQKIRDFHRLMYKAWAGSWTQRPEEVESAALGLQRKNFKQRPLIADAYAHAAFAAIRLNDSRQFYRMMFLAEAALSTTSYRSNQVYFNGKVLTDAYLRAGKWQNALIAGNNLIDPHHIALTNLRVLARAPQAVPLPNIRGRFEEWGDVRFAAEGIAGFVEFRLRSGDDVIETVQWIQGLQQPSLRAAAYAGVARAIQAVGVNSESATQAVRPSNPQISEPRSLIEAAEQLARELDDPIESAACLVEVARVWNLTGRQQSYDQAVAAFHDRCLSAWVRMWEQRSPSSRGYDNTYHDGRSSTQVRHERAEVSRLLQAQHQLALMQADLGDVQGALDTCLYMANHAGFPDQPDSEFATWYYLAIHALLIRMEPETGIGPDVLSSRQFYKTPYSEALVAAWTKDIAALKAAITKQKADPKVNELARAQAELAILYATRGDIDEYSSLRRSVVSQIRRKQAWPSMQSLLAVADARAGDLQLAQESLVDEPLTWTDGVGWPGSEIAIAFAKQGNADKALEAAKATSAKYAIYPCRAFAAAAYARYRAGSLGPELIEWVSTLKRPVDQVGAYCGLALAAENIQLP